MNEELGHEPYLTYEERKDREQQDIEDYEEDWFDQEDMFQEMRMLYMDHIH